MGRDFVSIYNNLGISDGKLADAIGVTRQTVRNWRKSNSCPTFALNAMLWLSELRVADPINDNIPLVLRARETAIS